MTKGTFNPNRPVQTRDGRSARIICTDVKDDRYPIAALVSGDDKEAVFKYRQDGKFAVSDNHYMDLVNVPLSSEEYVAKKGVVCPVCGTDDIDNQETEFAGDVLFQKVCCVRCGAEWTDEYALTGYCNLKTGKEDDE